MKVIERIGETIETFKACEKKWVEEELARGNNPDKAINVIVVRMLISLALLNKCLLLKKSPFC